MSTDWSLVASLADNKAALGRRYAEWAVSAPTLESAVAAAAMAQDELGHSRSTYPVLKQLGVDANEDGFGGDKRLALLDDELPDWNAFIAANLLVDGVLTTFVAACVDSSARADGRAREEDPPGGGLAPRARRGLGARACAAATSATRSSRACSETWEHAGRWIGPDDDPDVRRRAGGRRGQARPGAPARADARVAHRPARRARASSSSCPSSTTGRRLGPRAPPLERA